MKRVLILAYNFPPKGGGGVQRTAKFTKYLPDFGWQATVVAPDWRSAAGNTRLDSTLEADVEKAELIVTETKGDRGDRFWQALRQSPGGWRWVPSARVNLAYPDDCRWWIPWAIRAGATAIREAKFRAIYTTSPPVSAHLAGLRLKRRFGLPWIVDLRDPWTDNREAMRRKWRLRCAVEKRIERQAYASADAVIANTESNRLCLLDRHGLPPEKVTTITNGYDEEDFQESSTCSEKSEIFQVAFTGSAYGSYVPRWNLEVLGRFVKENPQASIRYAAAGSACHWIEKQVERDATLRPFVSCHGYLPHCDSIDLLKRSHLLVLDCPPGSPYWVPGKLYEYIRSGTPVVAISDGGSEVERILRSTGRGVSFPHECLDEAVRHLQYNYDQWSRGTLEIAQSVNSTVKLYDRRNLTGELARVLESVTA